MFFLGYNFNLPTELIFCSTDKMSEAAILDVVKKNFQDHLILGEEGGIIGDSSSDYLWCIDPLGIPHHAPCHGRNYCSIAWPPFSCLKLWISDAIIIMIPYLIIVGEYISIYLLGLTVSNLTWKVKSWVEPWFMFLPFWSYSNFNADGTTNFAHCYPSFAVSIGVLYKGKPAAASVVSLYMLYDWIYR